MQLARLLPILAVVVLAGCGGGDGGTAGDDTSSGVTTVPTQPPPATTGATTNGECRDVEAPAGRADGSEQAPEQDLDAAKTYRLVFETSCGSFTVTLDQKLAPKTAASLVSLVRKGFYDEMVFHRIVPGFVIQGGDPTQEGTGGPGYSTVDKPPATATYTKGVVAMAKSGAEAPGTSGSQFFVVTAEDAGLPPEYAVVGKVTTGLDVVEQIGTLGDPATELPLQPIVIDKVTVQES